MTKTLKKIIYQPYKWLFFLPFLAVNTILFGTLALLFSIIVNQKTGSYIGGALWSRLNCIFTPCFIRVIGKQNIQKNTSYVVVPNHQSYYDIFAIYGYLGLDIKFVMKKELEKIPGLGFGSKKVGHIFIDRSNTITAAKSLNEASKKLVNGTSVVIFPEGTRSTNGELLRFKKGAFKLALDLKLPILPVTINGTKNVLPNKTIDLMPGKIQVVVHEPIDTSKYDEKNIANLMNDTRSLIESKLIKS